MQKLKATHLQVIHSERYTSVITLATRIHIFVHRDAVHEPLQPPLYDGLYKVKRCTDKYFIVDVKNLQDTISLNRLKTAYLEADENKNNVQATSTTSTAPTATKPSWTLESPAQDGMLIVLSISLKDCSPVHWRVSTVVAHGHHMTSTWPYTCL